MQLDVIHVHAEQRRYLHLNNLVNALTTDPDLASIDKDNLANMFQLLFLATGYDYNSYFKSLGKATFWNNFFQYAHFITGKDMPGSLHQIDEQARFFAFIRLVGTVYFKNICLHLSRFLTMKHHNIFLIPSIHLVLHKSIRNG